MSQPTASTSTPIPASRSVDVREFAWLNPDEQLTQVYHYRTSYTEEGRLNREVVSQQELLHRIISIFKGRHYVDGNRILGSFPDVESAQSASSAIASIHAQHVEITGTELSIVL
jgi:hypothetical protein